MKFGEWRPLLHFGEYGPPVHFREFELMGSLLCTLVNGVPLSTLVNFGGWGPPFALWSILVTGVPPLDIREWGPPLVLW